MVIISDCYQKIKIQQTLHKWVHFSAQHEPTSDEGRHHTELNQLTCFFVLLEGVINNIIGL